MNTHGIFIYYFSCILDREVWISYHCRKFYGEWSFERRASPETCQWQIDGPDPADLRTCSRFSSTTGATTRIYCYFVFDVLVVLSVSWIHYSEACREINFLQRRQEVVFLPTLPTLHLTHNVCNMSNFEGINTWGHRILQDMEIENDPTLKLKDLKNGSLFCYVLSSKDFRQHAELCDELLQHYNAQWLERRTYWSARDRSCIQKDLLCIIVDSFDRSKVALPHWPYKRVPKRTVYEVYLRNLPSIEIGGLRNPSSVFEVVWDCKALRSPFGSYLCDLPWARLLPLPDW